jgi:hypothetical protein
MSNIEGKYGFGKEKKKKKCLQNTAPGRNQIMEC